MYCSHTLRILTGESRLHGVNGVIATKSPRHEMILKSNCDWLYRPYSDQKYLRSTRPSNLPRRSSSIISHLCAFLISQRVGCITYVTPKGNFEVKSLQDKVPRSRRGSSMWYCSLALFSSTSLSLWSCKTVLSKQSPPYGACALKLSSHMKHFRQSLWATLRPLRLQYTAPELMSARSHDKHFYMFDSCWILG